MTRNIEDMNIRNAIIAIEKRLDRIESGSQVPSSATLLDVIAVVNKIKNKDKRK